VRVDRIAIRLRPPRLAALLDGPDPSPQGANDEETKLLSVPARLRRAGREIRMVIDGTDPLATAKPNARLVKLLLRAAFHYSANLLVLQITAFWVRAIPR
jgi:hypothetical protein